MTESSLELKFFKSKDEALVLYPKLQGSCQKKKAGGEKSFLTFLVLYPWSLRSFPDLKF